MQQQIGPTIRELRLKRQMTGDELGKRTGISQSKISKIETGTIARPRIHEIETILNILDAPKTIRQQIFRTLDKTEILEIRRFKGSFAFTDALDELRKTAKQRVFTINLVPALLQTIEYRQDLMKFHEVTSDDWLRSTLQRQDMLWEGKRQFHLIMHETVLYNAVGGSAVQLAQLDRIERLMGIRNIKLGIMALGSGMIPADISSFAIYDERRLSKSIFGADIISHDNTDIAQHLKLFLMLDKAADYGDAAQMLIHKAMSHFS